MPITVDGLRKISSLDLSQATWRQVFETLDRNFDLMKTAVETAGDKFIMEQVSPISEGSRVVQLKTSYKTGANQLSVYYNGAIQWPGEGYREVSSRTLEFTFDISSSDDIRVMIVRPMFDGKMGEVIEDMQNTVADLKDRVDRFISPYEASSTEPTDLSKLWIDMSNPSFPKLKFYDPVKGSWVDLIRLSSRTEGV